MKLDADQIKSYRKRKLTQQELADMSGQSVRTIRRWETEGIPESEVKKAFVIVGMVSNLELKTEEAGR